MKRAALALVLLAAASSARADDPSTDLQRRAAILLGEIRAESGNPEKDKDVARLRAELGELKSEVAGANDDRAAAALKEAEDDLTLVDSGQPLPPPRPEDFPAADLPDRDAVASPTAPPVRSPALQKAASAAEAAGGIFDGALLHGGGAPAVSAPAKPHPSDPPSVPTTVLDAYLGLTDNASRKTFLENACADLISQMGLHDSGGDGAVRMAAYVIYMLESHPNRWKFTSVQLTADGDGTVHLIYKMGDDVETDESYDTVPNMMAAHKKLPGPKKGRKKRKSKGGGHGGGDDSEGGSGKHGHKKSHGGGGGGGDDDGGDGGDGGGGSGGGGGGGHARVPHMKGGGADGSAFDGGDASGDVSGPAGHSGRGGGRGRRGGSSSASSGDGDDGDSGDGDGGGRSGGAGAGAGRRSGHASAGGGMSSGEAGDGDGGGSEGEGGKRGARVPLPKDFTTRGGAPGLSEPGGGEAGGGAPHFTPKSYVKNGAPSANAAAPGASSPSGNVSSAVAVPAGGADAPLKAPIVSSDEDLHDAVAAHSANAPRLSLPQPTPGQDAPPDSDGSSFPWPAASGAAGIGLFLGAQLFRRRAEKQAKDASKSSTLD